jgi:S-adenosylmethionine synthetase
MILNKRIKHTVETVLSGHPDKVCDQICDAILDAYISEDKSANVTVECMGTGDTIFLGGEVSSDVVVNIPLIVRSTYKDIGYDQPIKIVNRISAESTQTNAPIQNGEAGDQGIMYGYACSNPAANFLPQAVFLVNKIAKEIDRFGKSCDRVLPDGKVQITLSETGEVETLVVCMQHKPGVVAAELEKYVIDSLTQSVPEIRTASNTFFNYHSNFVLGGFQIDAGLSGRKIIADTYCGLAPHGGGSFSGKDPFRLDRSGAYMSRYVAKSIVANGLAEECLIAVSYVFGYDKTVMLEVSTGNEKLDKQLRSIINKHFDFRPPAIVERLHLYEFSFRQTATFGHFTNMNYPWEQIVSL